MAYVLSFKVILFYLLLLIVKYNKTKKVDTNIRVRVDILLTVDADRVGNKPSQKDLSCKSGSDNDLSKTIDQSELRNVPLLRSS